MIELEATADGILLPVHAQPRARRSGIVGVHGGRLKVAVTQAPEQGRANEALVQALADALRLKKSQIELIGGASASRKIFRISAVGLEELRIRLDEVLASIG